MLPSFVLIFFFCAKREIALVLAAEQNDEIRLVEHLLANYSKQARPVIKPQEAVNSTFGIEIVHLIKVDDRNQMLTIKLWVRQQWKNELLTWNPEYWGGTTEVQIDGDLVWVPDIVLYNNADDTFSGGTEKYKTRIIMYDDGTAFWLAPATFTSTCSIDIKYFPFDKQTCTLKFGSWTFDINGINMFTDLRPVITSQYSKSSEWDILQTKKTRTELLYQCCPEPYVDITFSIVLLRKPLYFVFNVITPCLILVMTVLFGFFLPPESGERISLTITILLAVAVFLQLISDALPRNSNSIPILAVFYMVIMAESAFSLITTCIVLVIHYRSNDKGSPPMPKWVHSFFLGTCAKLFGIHENTENPKGEQRQDATTTTTTKIALRQQAQSFTYDNDYFLDDFSRENKSGMQDLMMTTSKSFEGTLDVILKEVQIITSNMVTDHQQGELQEDWRMLAKVLDRLFFWLFLLTVVFSAVGILVPVYLINH